jgi:PAS domain S-box-containing protein
VPLTVARSILQSLSLVANVQVRLLADLPEPVASDIAQCGGLPENVTMEVAAEDRRYLAHRFDAMVGSVVVVGPYRTGDAGSLGVPYLDPEQVAAVRASLDTVGETLGVVQEQQRDRVELASQFELMSSAIIAITGELALETVLDRIVDLARAVAGAKYAALGVPNESGDLESFITSGLTKEEEERIGNPPRGHGVLGALIRERRTIRIPVLSDHPASVGFPPNHPPMTSFLGLPITARGKVLGNLYLTEKRFAPEFTEEDARLVELLARHAAVAIDNARLYEELGAQQQRLEFMVDQLPEAVVFFERDPDRVTVANRQASHLLGWDIRPPLSLEEFLRRNTRIDADGNQIDSDEFPVVRSLRFGEIVTRSEILAMRPDGSRLTLLVNSAPLRLASGEIRGAIVVFQDITQIKDAEQLKDDFLSLVSHELRTPLTTLHGGAHLLMTSGDALDDETTREILADMYGESRRLATLVENMVQLANIRAGRFRIEAEPVHVPMLIRRAIHAVQDIAPARQIRAEADNDLLASGDYGSLDQVLRNLIQNAIKYVPDDSQIEVAARSVDGQVLISVRDHGEGIEPADVPLLFERFQRGRQSDRTAGMGLGLYLSRQIVEAHGGSIWVEIPEDGGSRFVFTVPAVLDDPHLKH